MRTIETTCKICRKRVIVEFPTDKDCNPETLQTAVDTFLPMVCCNRCYDLHDKRQRAGENIQRLARVIGWATPKQREEIARHVRASFEKSLGEYVVAVCGQLRVPCVPLADGVDRLMQKPEEWQAILKGYRMAARSAARQPSLPEIEAQPT